jgi:hypothetical protein
MSKPAQILRVTAREQFDWLIDHLMTEIHRAHDHSNLWRDVDAAFAEYREEANQTPQFWQLTRQSLQDSVILRLGRLFDPTSGALSLGNFLRTIRHHATASDPTFLSPALAGISLATLDAESAYVSESDASVASLLGIRNRYLAHREAHMVGSGSLSSLPSLERERIESLLGRALNIVNEYRRICGRPFVSSNLPGGDDYRHLFELLRSGLGALKSRAQIPE